MADNQIDNFFVSLEKQIKQLAKLKGITLSDLARSIEMTEAGFHKTLSSGSVKLRTLKKIAEVFNQPIKIFFDEPGIYGQKIQQSQLAEPNEVYTNEKEGLKKQIMLLESQLKDKDKIIELLSKK